MDRLKECDNFEAWSDDSVSVRKRFTMQPVLRQAEKIENWIQYGFDVVYKNENLMNIISSLVIIQQSEIVWRNGLLSFPGFLFAWPLVNLFHYSLNQQCCPNSLKLSFLFTLIFTFMILWTSINSWLYLQELFYQKLQPLTIEGQLLRIHLYDPYYWILRLRLTTSTSPTFYMTQEAAIRLSVALSTLLALIIFICLRLYRTYTMEPFPLSETISKEALEIEHCMGDGPPSKRDRKFRSKIRHGVTTSRLRSVKMHRFL